MLVEAMGGLCPVSGLAGRPFAAGLGGSEAEDEDGAVVVALDVKSGLMSLAVVAASALAAS